MVVSTTGARGDGEQHRALALEACLAQLGGGRYEVVARLRSETDVRAAEAAAAAARGPALLWLDAAGACPAAVFAALRVACSGGLTGAHLIITRDEAYDEDPERAQAAEDCPGPPGAVTRPQRFPTDWSVLYGYL
jgi:hypothetical protein